VFPRRNFFEETENSEIKETKVQGGKQTGLTNGA
jgi:hypothetical protein